ncbi:hypothetical protein QBC46DRAFT_62008 [Diplogelasinospora grovesii]|uniref:Membrane anchor Opy2 N-terminal domain-containing protein n=1 Tax=Diplogelasinospora grovesii TaxID=303347 RepID=A0AAN6NHF4_9PEZI|nr:hypothetical protein QBC46DRAFT_62008 [Diplogelasinospora grovesii]
MTATLGSATATLEHMLGKRVETCLACDASTQLVCPSCVPGVSQCQFIYPTSCHECARATCVPIEPTSTPSSSSGPSTNVGAIAGGVIGGLAAIAIVTYLVWRYCIRARRQPVAQEVWDEEQEQGDGVEKAFAQRRNHRASTHTVHSIASTVLTRASNIIQIAYIPGVTNRATPTSPTVLVPPVPPIPIAISQANSPAGTEDQHFFVPGDLRDSTYSGISGYTDRTSYARTSYAPRSSVASTIYGKNAVIVAPAQTGMRAKPAMVSVRSANSNNSGGSSTPPVPSVDYEKYNGLMRPPSPANSTFSVGSTFLNNATAHTATPARAMVVRMGSQNGPRKIGIGMGKPKAPEQPAVSSPGAASPTVRDSTAATIIDDSPSVDQGPFSDPPKPANQSVTSLSAVIEEATRRASQRGSGNQDKERERSPFGDEHATQD